MRLKLSGKYSDGTPKVFVQPESGKQTEWLKKNFSTERKLKARLIGDDDTGIMLQLKIEQ
ncbi:MAG: hypothetical protein AMS21_01040 [Gemmatimonas sp. SG8_38_2]|nr:MAG: hypothetical protein AMS21_01040 [Gemmatimonas sp. SG8_38_2]